MKWTKIVKKEVCRSYQTSVVLFHKLDLNFVLLGSDQWCFEFHLHTEITKIKSFHCSGPCLLQATRGSWIWYLESSYQLSHRTTALTVVLVVSTWERVCLLQCKHTSQVSFKLCSHLTPVCLQCPLWLDWKSVFTPPHQLYFSWCGVFLQSSYRTSHVLV